MPTLWPALQLPLATAVTVTCTRQRQQWTPQRGLLAEVATIQMMQVRVPAGVHLRAAAAGPVAGRLAGWRLVWLCWQLPACKSREPLRMVAILLLADLPPGTLPRHPPTSAAGQGQGQKRDIESLAALEHDGIKYPPFNKDFYEEAPQVAAMSQQEVSSRG